MKKFVMAGMVLSILCNFALALSLVWTNTQRAGLAYELKRQQQVLGEMISFNAKLGVERDRLLSPYYLDRRAAELGLRSADQNQKRFMH
ncbi:hypothetical protein LJC48_07905 [Desulfovibrio sp. OttesenSCG-928-C06]|nr:hypothetical protein [Desulfovibrio sp. OttesenSCG-928-C06]